ncbi:MAG: Flp family type IVb pilin [Actinomycetota bacterium]|nr:Flp family type IVb pilin [Actinomycetota bacterium]
MSRDPEAGAVGVEYSLLLLVIFMVIIVAVRDFGIAVLTMFANAASAF